MIHRRESIWSSYILYLSKLW